MLPRESCPVQFPMGSRGSGGCVRKSNFNALYSALSHAQTYTCSAAASEVALLHSVSFSLLLFMLLCLICWDWRKGVRQYASFCSMQLCSANAVKIATGFAPYLLCLLLCVL